MKRGLNRVFRVVFNAARGVMMAVSEQVKRKNKSGKRSSIQKTPHENQLTDNELSQWDGVSWTKAERALAYFSVASMMVGVGIAGLTLYGTMSSAHGQVISDPNGGVNRPVITQSGNGVPVVEIVRPNGAGVSVNQYSQFDVQNNGVVLNNSGVNTQTQLGGWVNGNPNLVGGSATVIVNEVNSNRASTLNGYMEVAGQRAHVVVSNANGITCNGCGWINASQGTLTSGEVKYGVSGSLDGYVVRGGSVIIEGSGLNGNGAEWVEVLARAVKVNAGLWADRVKVITGINEIKTDGTIKKLAANQALDGKPEFALDVGAVGGMYAGKIVLVGTEAGLGVNNTGVIEAIRKNGGGEAGELSLSVDGELRNRGSIRTSGNMDVKAVGVDNSGLIESGGSVGMSTEGVLKQEGRIEAGGDVKLSGAVGLELKASGEIVSGGAVGLEGGSGLAKVNGKVSGTSVYVGVGVSGEGVEMDGSVVRTNQMEVRGNSGDVRGVGAVWQVSEVLSVQGKNEFNSAGSQISAGRLDLSTISWNNEGGQVLLRDSLSVSLAGALNNKSGVIATQGNIDVQANALDNSSGTISQSGVGASVLNVSGALNNTSGVIESNGVVQVDSGSLNNDGGRVQGSGLEIATGAMSNKQGKVFQTNQSLGMLIDSESLDNSGGLISQSGVGASVLNVSGALNNTSGVIESNGVVQVDSGSLNNEGGRVQGSGLEIATGAMSNLSGVLLQGDQQGEMKIEAVEIDNRGGKVLSAGSTQVEASRLNNAGGVISQSGLGDSTLLVSETLNNARGVIESNGSMSVKAKELNNEGGRVQGNGLLIETERLSNRGGNVLQSEKNRSLEIKSVGLNNAQGVIGSVGASSLSIGGDWRNEGDLLSNGLMSVNVSGELSNAGKIAGGGVDVKANTVNNEAKGEISSGGTSKIEAQNVNNIGLIDGVETWLQVSGTLRNYASATDAGRIYGNTVRLGGGKLSNEGLVDEAGNVMKAPVIGSRGDMELGMQEVQNLDGASVLVLGNLKLGGSLDVSGKAIGEMDLFRNGSAKVEVDGDVSGNVKKLVNENLHFKTSLEEGESANEKDWIIGDGIYRESEAAWMGTHKTKRRSCREGQDNRQICRDVVSGRLYYISQGSVHAADAEKKEYFEVVDVLSADGDGVSYSPYKKDDKVWEAFGMDNPQEDLPIQKPIAPTRSCGDGGQCLVTSGPRYDAYLEELDAYNKKIEPWKELEAKIESFKESVISNSVYIPGDGDFRTYTETKYDVKVDVSKPGSFKVGGDLRINGQEVINDKSQLLVGGGLSVLGGELKNIGATVESKVERSGDYWRCDLVRKRLTPPEANKGIILALLERS